MFIQCCIFPCGIHKDSTENLLRKTSACVYRIKRECNEGKIDDGRSQAGQGALRNEQKVM